jgi:hypothetical protein
LYIFLLCLYLNKFLLCFSRNLIEDQSESAKPYPCYHTRNALWCIYNFFSCARKKDSKDALTRKRFSTFVTHTMLKVPFLKDLSLSTTSNFDSTSKRFKYYLDQSSKLICRFLNPGFEFPAEFLFHKSIVIPDGFTGMDPNKEEEIFRIDLFTVEGIMIIILFLVYH